MNNKCPKCGKKISPFYLKQNCPHCNVDLLYYKLDERLEADAAESLRQEMKLKHLKDTIVISSFSHPLLIFRFILFFTPLASMCLPMYKGLTLINLIIGIIKGTLDTNQYLLPIISMALVIVLSLVVIINSLFSATKSGLARNIISSAVNTLVFVGLGMYIGSMGLGWYITLAIYILEIIMHFAAKKPIFEAEMHSLADEFLKEDGLT